MHPSMRLNTHTHFSRHPFQTPILNQNEQSQNEIINILNAKMDVSIAQNERHVTCNDV